MSDEPKAMPPQERTPEGGNKDTNDLSDIKGIQDKGMAQKGQDVDQLPEGVVGTDTPKFPQRR
ncbi:MAG: hypothetical protein Q4C89_14000 [Deinococcus sp.]|uniref:hypothetical protein n=1 Tax=Deinococcus sp. TaxID=47478 RepID=UPI0026DAEEF1|nr:hypothetical protein [Deinococcus sp.]MDO4247127.1 hypothetical protein [Deinococcus sp.]